MTRINDLFTKLCTKEVCAYLDVSRYVVWDKRKKGLFPEPFKVVKQRNYWLKEEIDELILASLRGDSEKELKILIKKMEKNRKKKC